MFYAMLALVLLMFFPACNKMETCEECNFSEIRGFVIDTEGTKYISTDDGLFSLSENGWMKESSIMLNYELRDIDLGADENLWAATNKGLLNVFADTLISSSVYELVSDDIRHIDIDDRNNLYLATPAGVSVFYEGQWYDTTGRDAMFLGHPITDIATSSNNFTYVTLLGGGVGRFSANIDGITGATLFDVDWAGLKSNTVFTVFIDDTVQYYGTDRGVAIHYTQFTKWDWENIRQTDGLLSDTVLSIVMDQEKTLWFGTPKGLSRFDGEKWSAYTQAVDGLLSDTIQFMAVDPSGLLWIASPEGFTQFDGQEFIHYLK